MNALEIADWLDEEVSGDGKNRGEAMEAAAEALRAYAKQETEDRAVLDELHKGDQPSGEVKVGGSKSWTYFECDGRYFKMHQTEEGGCELRELCGMVWVARFGWDNLIDRLWDELQS